MTDEASAAQPHDGLAHEKERIIWDATFNSDVTTYWLLSGCLVCVVTVVGIPLLPLWFFGGQWITRKYLASHRCTLTSRSLKVAKGILTRTEKTVPLDRLTDVAIVQGPLMRIFKIESLSVETAGQSSAGSLVHLVGIENGRKFRDAILRQRDAVVASAEELAPTVGGDSQEFPADSGEVVGLLTEIRDSLRRLESQRGVN